MSGQKLYKKQKLIVDIESIAPGGEGVSKDQGMPIFVARSVPGDKLEIEVYDVRKTVGFAKPTAIIAPSPNRCEPPCKLFKICGGCQWQHITYEAQLQYKTEIVKQALKHIGKFADAPVHDTIACATPFHYRNKVQYPVSNPANSARILAGYYREGSHELVNIKHCPIQPSIIDTVIAKLKELLEEISIKAYDEKTQQGLLRHIVCRVSQEGTEVLVTLVVNAAREQSADLQRRLLPVADQLIKTIPAVTGFCLNFNPCYGNRILTMDSLCLQGNDHIEEILRSHRDWAPQCLRTGLKFRLSPTSFFQVNSSQAEVLLDLVLENALNQEQKPQLIIDAYAGVGTIAFWLAAATAKVIALEEAPSAIEDGRQNLLLNKISNVEMQEGTVESLLPELLAQNVRPDILVLDPPRKGVSTQAITSLMQFNCPRIIYVSCNPASLSRDLRILVDSGYKLTSVQPVDMFPQTYHVESVSLLERV